MLSTFRLIDTYSRIPLQKLLFFLSNLIDFSELTLNFVILLYYEIDFLLLLLIYVHQISNARFVLKLINMLNFVFI